MEVFLNMDMKTLFKISYGIYVVGSCFDGKMNAQTANSVLQINNEPATVAISLNNNNLTNEFVNQSGVFSINILAADTDLALIGNFGFQSGRDYDKFKDYPATAGVTGSPILTGASIAGTLEAEVIEKLKVGTHTIFVGKIVAAENTDKDVMTYAMYHQKKNAAKIASSTTKAYKCSVCGYVVESGFEDLPADWVCPVCGVGKDKFFPI